jgi:PBSX family phage terminase large subunit
MSNKELAISPTQMEFVNSQQDYTLFCGGLGSGKTFAGAVWAVHNVLNYENVIGLITANSYSQLKKATLPKFFEILDTCGIPYIYKSQDGIIEVNGTLVYAISMEKYDLLRGIEVGWAWSDECGFYKKEAFEVLIGRIRDKRGSCQWKGTTTPNGFNWLYTTFVEKPVPNSKVVYSKTLDNLSNLPEQYVRSLQAQYDSKLAQQELDGQFVNLSSGKVYYSFDRKKHIGKADELHKSIWCGLDFNVHPLCGVFGFETEGKIFISGELYQEDSNTFKAAKEILRRYPDQIIHVVADESGTKRKTNAENTDYEILRRANLNVLNFRNPWVKDRYNNINRLLDHGLLIIDPSCKKLIQDLEKLTYDNTDPMLSHISDALGYLCWKLNPMKKPKRNASVTYL